MKIKSTPKIYIQKIYPFWNRLQIFIENTGSTMLDIHIRNFEPFYLDHIDFGGTTSLKSNEKTVILIVFEELYAMVTSSHTFKFDFVFMDTVGNKYSQCISFYDFSWEKHFNFHTGQVVDYKIH